MQITIKKYITISICLVMSFLLLSSGVAQNTTSTRNFNDATGFSFGDIKFDMQYSAVKPYLLNATANYTQKGQIYLCVGKMGNRFLDMPVSDTVEMGFASQKLSKIVFIINPSDLNTDNITKAFGKNPEALTEEWSYWVKGNYVLDITVDSIRNKKRIQLEYMGF